MTKLTGMTPRLQVQFFEEGHQYLLNNSEAPSVTTILDAEGLAGTCEFWKPEHRMRGTAVHRIALLLGKRPWRGGTVDEIVANSAWDPDRTAPVLVPYGLALARWYLDTGFRPELTEQPVGSAIWGIAGTLDQWGAMPNGEKWLIDFKSGQPQPAADLQTQLYAMCLHETFGLTTDQRAVLWLKPEGDYRQMAPRPPGGIDQSVACSAINLYKWRLKHKKLG